MALYLYCLGLEWVVWFVFATRGLAHFLSAALGTFKYSGECFKFLLMAAIELFLANLSIKVGQGWMNGILSWLKDLDASV